MQNRVLRDMLCKAKRDMPDGRDCALRHVICLQMQALWGGLGKYANCVQCVDKMCLVCYTIINRYGLYGRVLCFLHSMIKNYAR